MSDTPQHNPWKGLNTYVEGEVIYGRDEEIAQLAAQVTQSTQTVLYGRSGIGKSSIINAGIFPRVRHEGYFPVNIRFDHNAASYTTQVRQAVMQALADLRPGREGGPYSGQAEELMPLHGTEADESLWEFFHRFRYTDHKGRPVRPLIVVDQFEEIFTLATDRQRVDDFFRQLADLLNGIMPDALVPEAPTAATEADPSDFFSALAEQLSTRSYLTDSEFSIVIVLREDFLSYLERATAFIPSLRNNRFPLRPINDEQAADIIMQPRPGLVPKDVAELIIQRITGDDTVHIDNVPEVEVDSAILSLYLSRLYDKMRQQGLPVFTRQLVEAHSSDIISDFYEESTRGLSFTALRFLEEELVNREGRRDNRDRLTVLERTGLSAAQLDHLVRDVKLLRQFSYGSTLRIEFIHDILCPTIVAHRQKMAMARAARRTRHRLWLGITGVLVLAFVVGTWMAVGWWQNDAEMSECYASFTRRDGWPEGVGQPLGKGERAQSPIYYRLSKRGHKAGPFTRVEVCSSNPLLPDEPRLECLEVNPVTDNFASTDARAQAFVAMLSRVASIDFAAGEDGRIEKEVMRAEGGKPLFVVSYFHQGDAAQSRSLHEAWQTFLTPEGQSLQVRDNHLDRAKVVWDSCGRLSSVTWFDQQGVTLAAADSAFGYRFTYLGADTVIRRALDDCGLLLQPGNGWNTLVTARRAGRTDRWYALLASEDDTPRWHDYLANAHMGCAHTVSLGRDTTIFYRVHGSAEQLAARVSRRTDAHGNVVTETAQAAPGEAATFLSHHPARTVCTYDAATGRRTLHRLLNAQGRPFAPTPSAVHTEQWRYATDGRQLLASARSARGVEYAVSRTYDRLQRITTESSERYGQPYSAARYEYQQLKSNGVRTVITCIDRSGHPANQLRHFGDDALSVSRIITDSVARRVTRTFYALTPEGHNAPLPVVRNEYGTATSFFRLVDTYDADGNRITQQAFDALGNVVRSMRYEFQNGELIGRYAMGLDGSPVRCTLWEEEGYAYYKMYFTRNFDGQFNALKAVNEWERPSVFYDYAFQDALQIRFFNLHGDTLTSGYKINADVYTYQLAPTSNLSHLKVPYLHFHHAHHPLHDGNWGLRDGDRIVRLGKWHLGGSEEAFRTEWRRLMQGHQMQMLVAKPIVAGNREAYKECELSIKGITAPPDEDYHFLPLTADEAHSLVHM